MSPRHSIDICPICGGGLCGVRICGIAKTESGSFDPNKFDNAHGLIICDECEAIWLEPDTSSDHVYPDSEIANCPVCSEQIWGAASRWAETSDIKVLGWSEAINHDLDVAADPDQGLV